MLGRLLCLFGLHKRSRSRARPTQNGGWVSRCRNCRQPMQRLEDGHWRLLRESKR